MHAVALVQHIVPLCCIAYNNNINIHVYIIVTEIMFVALHMLYFILHVMFVSLCIWLQLHCTQQATMHLAAHSTHCSTVYSACTGLANSVGWNPFSLGTNIKTIKAKEPSWKVKVLGNSYLPLKLVSRVYCISGLCAKVLTWLLLIQRAINHYINFEKVGFYLVSGEFS